MNIKIENIPEINENCIVLNGTKDQLKLAKKNYKTSNIVIDNEYLNLNTPFYGTSKKETKLIQKANLKKVKAVYFELKKFIWFFKFKRVKSITFYIEKLDNKKNNNNKMLLDMLNLKFNTFFLFKLKKSVMLACEFLDNENAELNMCDFKDNRCAKHRARGFERSTGCCPASCKHMQCGPCKTKNISCKLIMCDYLEQNGYYFTPHTLGQLTQNMWYLERVVCIGLFFKSTKKCIATLWFVRIMLAVVALLPLLIIL